MTRKGGGVGTTPVDPGSTNSEALAVSPGAEGAPGEDGAAGATGNQNEVPSMAELEAQIPKWAMVTGSIMLVSLPLLYFFFCYTGRMICRKAGSKPGYLIWVPLLSLIPLTRAARLPAWMAALFIVPFLNLLFMVVWCVRLSNARGKGILAALFLLCPITSPMAWLYLAYSK